MATLVKLKIQGFEDPACVAKKQGEINAFINPSTYKRTFTTIYGDSPEGDSNAPTQVFKRIGKSDLKLNFFVDGTGIVPLPKKFANVDAYIDAFTDLVYGFKGNIHRPYYLLVTWGTLTFTGICTSLDVTYDLFTPDGKALRASIDVTLSESIDYKTKAKEAAKSSPDLTHMRIVKAGDTLPLLTYQIYGDSSYYVEVAKKNNLSSFNAIKPGDVLYFHPLTNK
jgi:nucleoid-associated protein YgaU